MDLSKLTISEEHIKDTCKFGEGAVTCSYLTLSGDGFKCGKTSPSIKKLIDQRRAQGTIKAMGDGCQGWGHPALMVLGSKAVA